MPGGPAMLPPGGDPERERWPAAARLPGPALAGLELGGDQEERQHEEYPALQERQHRARDRQDEQGRDCDGHQRLTHYDPGATNFATQEERTLRFWDRRSGGSDNELHG